MYVQFGGGDESEKQGWGKQEKGRESLAWRCHILEHVYRQIHNSCMIMSHYARNQLFCSMPNRLV